VSERPVVVFGRGGATETVARGVSGAFLADQSAEAILSATRIDCARDRNPFRACFIVNRSERIDNRQR
jgi:hypothetical protein